MQNLFQYTRPTFQYQGTSGLLVVFDVSLENCLETTVMWVDEAKQYAPNSEIFLVGNVRQNKERQVTCGAAKKYADSVNIQYFETCLETGEGVRILMESLLKEMVCSYYSKRVDYGGELVVEKPSWEDLCVDWSPKANKFFEEVFKERVMTLLLCLRRAFDEGTLPRLPKFVFFEVVKKMGETVFLTPEEKENL